MSLRNTSKAISPPWLQDGNGEKIGYTIAIGIDASLESAILGVDASFPGRNASALPYLGQDLVVERMPGDTDERYAARITKSVNSNKRRGSAQELIRQIANWFFPANAVPIRLVGANGFWHSYNYSTDAVTRSDIPNWVWDPIAYSSLNRGWVILDCSGGAAPFARSFRGVRVRGAGTIGSTATQSQVEQIKSIVRNWKPEHVQCKNIIVTFNSATFLPTDTSPSQLPNARGELCAWRLTHNAMFWGTS